MWAVRAAFVFCLLLLGCGPTVGAPAAARHDSILGGGPDTTTSTVFILDLRFDNGQSAICSSVLVSPRVLLTAAHCVDPSLKGATSVTVKATNKADATMLMMSDMIDATMISRHSLWNPGDTMNQHDLALLLLATAPAGVTPVPLQRSLSGFTGQPIRVLGYGVTTSGGTDAAIRRAVTLNVSSVATNTYDFGSAGNNGICSGDSGGPSLYTSGGTERVVGIHSRTNSGSCGVGTDIRVDTHLPFIDGFVQANDPALCSADGRCASGCTTTDPDCPVACGMDNMCNLACATPDPDCCAANSRCDTMCPAGVRDPDCVCIRDGTCEASCPSGVTDPDCLCRADGRCEASCPSGVTDPDCGCGADSVCVATCPAVAPDPDCADCAMNGVCSAASCPTADPDCHLDGEVCTAATDCVGRQCLPDPRGFSFCSRSCADSAVCQLDMVCTGGVCRAPSKDMNVTGGCTAAPGPLFALLGVVVWLRRRARR